MYEKKGLDEELPKIDHRYDKKFIGDDRCFFLLFHFCLFTVIFFDGFSYYSFVMVDCTFLRLLDMSLLCIYIFRFAYLPGSFNSHARKVLAKEPLRWQPELASRTQLHS